MTGTSQCIPYHLQHIDNGALGIEDCDNEKYAGATQDAGICSNKPNTIQEKVLLLEFQE